jgi:hypothetical protein
MNAMTALRDKLMKWRANATEGTAIDREKRVGAYFNATLIVTALSGFVTFLWPTRAAEWQQWTFLIHTAQGLILTLLLAVYLYLHFKRSLAMRRPGIALSGIIAAFGALLIVASGLHITLFGQTEARRTVYWIHVLAGAGVVLLIVAHVLLHRLTWPSRRQEQRPAVLSISAVTRRWTVGHTVAAVGVLLVGSGAGALLPSPYEDVAAIQPYDLSKYGEKPFWPSRNQTASGGFYDAKRVGSSHECGVCHADIFKEWSSSIHAKAASDRAYQTNVNLLATKKGMPATRYCEGCHAPVAIMSGQLTGGGKLDTHGHMKEGVGCLSCHAIDSVLNTAGVASFMHRPPEQYLFEGYDNSLARTVHNYIVRLNPSLHRSEMSRKPLKQPEMCATCHAQFMPIEMNEWGWVKMQDDYTAWLNGPFSGQSKHTFARGDVTRCQDCHFPLVKADDPSADRRGRVHSHFSLGANTAIPFVDGDEEHIRRITAFLQSNKVTVSIDKPTRPRAVTNDRYVQPDISHLTETMAYYYLGEEATIHIVVANNGVGHDFPGGTSDINEAWVHFVATDAQGQVIYESGAVRPDGEVDPEAYFYRSTAVDKAGLLVWRHDLFRMVGDSFKKVVEPGSSDVVTYNVKIPAWAKSPMNIYAVICYRKLNNRYARWALKDEKIVLPIVDVASDTLKVPLREKPEAIEEDLEPKIESLTATPRASASRRGS